MDDILQQGENAAFLWPIFWQLSGLSYHAYALKIHSTVELDHTVIPAHTARVFFETRHRRVTKGGVVNQSRAVLLEGLRWLILVR